MSQQASERVLQLQEGRVIATLITFTTITDGDPDIQEPIALRSVSTTGHAVSARSQDILLVIVLTSHPQSAIIASKKVDEK